MSDDKAKFLTDEATRQEHLSDLLEWMNVRVNIYAREYKTHKAEQDRIELVIYENTIQLLKGYLDSFTKAVVTDVEEPKIKRDSLADVNTRYEHLVSLAEMWRDAAVSLRDQYVGKIAIPLKALGQIRKFEKAVNVIEIHQEGLAGLFASRQYPAYKDGAARVLKAALEEAERAGVTANKKRLLDEAQEAEAKAGIPPKEQDDDKILSDTQEATGSGQKPDDEDEAGYALN